ncbi:MAG: hypothetical protein ACTHVU_13610 [Corynebacterium sp.]|uniref:hypothetical protein n=1 Tax=Corynebacterium sp. TaxID=1720 RepID=UPI003F8DC768
MVDDTDPDAAWPGKPPPEVEAIIQETVEMIHELDDTGLHEMTPLFYQHAYEQVRTSLSDLLKILGHDPDVAEGRQF